MTPLNERPTPLTDARIRRIRCCSNSHRMQCAIDAASEFVDTDCARSLEQRLGLAIETLETIAIDNNFHTWNCKAIASPFYGGSQRVMPCTCVPGIARAALAELKEKP